MSRLKELINKLCPDGVEYRPLWQVTIWDKRFNRVEKTKQAKVAKFRHVSAKELKELKRDCGDVALLSTGEFSGYTSKDNASNNYNSGEVIAIPSGGTANVKYYKGEFIDSGNILAVSSNKDLYDLKFIYYALLTKQNLLQSYFRGSGIKHPEMPAILEIQIPLPPIEIQKEIVKILDKFTKYDTELQSELQSELQDRIKQYEYYRDKLLNFDEKSSGRVTYRKLGEICTISAGGDVPKNAFSKTSTKEYSVPIYSNGVGSNALYGYTNRAKICKPCVTIAARGTIGYSVLREEPFYPVVRLICLMPKKELNPGYLNYYLQTIKFDIPKTGIPQLTVPMVSRTVIPLPPLAVQNRIVNVLDDFGKICSDLKIGLPAEIKMHQKRYEYYRDKLLSFPEKK